jgi:endonuclease/exonuclease/phosphatase family metal-dependent hydrolase
MKKAVRIAGITITIVVAALYVICSLAIYFSAENLPLVTIASLLYLPVLVGYVLLLIIWLLRKKRIAILLLLIFFIGFKSFLSTVALNFLSPRWKWEKDNGSVRVMSWNVNRLGNQYNNKTIGVTGVDQNMLQYISRVDPDILCIQDVSDKEDRDNDDKLIHCISLLQEAGNFKAFFYSYFLEYRTHKDTGRLGVALFSKFPIIDTGSVLTQGHNKLERAGYMDVLLKGKAVRVFAVHLSSMSLWPTAKDEAGLNYLEGDSTKSRAKTIFSKIEMFGEYHAREAEVVKKFVDQSPYPVIFSADMNSVPSSYVYSHLKKGLYDAFLEKDHGIGGTYNRIFPKLRIDVLLHSKQLEVLQFTRPVTDLSDHYPLIADFKWKE